MSLAPDAWPFVSIIVPFYGDEIDALDRCVEAVMVQDYPGERFELVLVDNNPAPVVRDRYSGLARSPRIVHEPKAAGYQARNTGIEHARGQALAFTDADCQPDRGWLRHGVGMLNRDRGCGFVAGNIALTFRDPKKPALFEAADACFHLQQEAYVRNYHFGATANLLTWKSVIETAGPFDATLISQGDGEWGKRVWRLGYRQYYAKDAVVYHSARTTFGALAVKTRRLFGADFARGRAQGLARILRYELGYQRLLLRWIAERRHEFGLRRIVGVYAVFGLVVAIRGVELVRLLAGGRRERR
ncbi:MAG TPA: glycosyltransferase [Stellaceae bacterium]|nr:glycosyltransferase [Stellaceae bacterium]